MNTSFSILSGQTVAPGYVWDQGVPNFINNINVVPASTNITGAIVGYAPGLRVVFSNNSSFLTPYTDVYGNTFNVTEEYAWNFGDFYNPNNITVGCNIPVEHTYIIPGVYTVTLNHTTVTNSQTLNPVQLLCIDKYGIQWYWNNLFQGLAQGMTWADAADIGKYAKTWASETKCLQKYCKFWDWTDLKTDAPNPISWADSDVGGKYPKLWQNEAATGCDSHVANITNTSTTSAQQYTLTLQVSVGEILPVAALNSVNNGTYYDTVTGASPFNVRLSPVKTVTGSLPIERIDWNFGDTPTVYTINRHTTPDPDIFIKNNVFSLDTLDPRNYDAVYTYTRNKNQPSTYYPSITAYSSSTETYDTVSTTVNIGLQNNNKKIKLLKVRNTNNGNLYTIDVDGQIAFVTTGINNTNTSTGNVTLTSIPANPLRTSNNTPLYYSGNNGSGYPAYYTAPACTATVPVVDNTIFLETEDGTPILLENSISQPNTSYDGNLILP